MGKLRILIAEDHTTVLEGIKMIDTQADMEVVGEAADGVEALSAAQALHPDLVLMDVAMPRLNGMKATEAILEKCPSTKVLMLTRHTETAYVRQLFRAGAAGYVLKQSRSSELLKAIRTVGAGGTYVDPAVAGELVRDYRPDSTAPMLADAPRLSMREVEVLRLVATGLANKEIAAQLELSVKTIETHKANAMNKLGIQSRIEIVRFGLLQGWLNDI